MIKIHHIGRPTTIPGWPQADTIEGLLDALSRWTLDPRLDLREPEERHLPAYRGRAWGSCTGRWNPEKHRTIYTATKPIYPDSPDAVRYTGNFIGYSFGFTLDTDEPELIARLDAAIAQNMARGDYVEAAQSIRDAEAARTVAPRMRGG